MSTPDVTILHGDCRELMKSLPDGSVDAIVTDPPWMDYETSRYDASEWHNPVCYVSPSEYAWDLYRVLRPESAAILWCRWDCFATHAGVMEKAGFTVRNCIVWAKSYHTAGDLDGNLGNQHETAVFAVKGKWKRHGARETNCWTGIAQPFSKVKRDHPTQKPIALMKRCVELACPVGGVVLDPFAGSGSTLVACMKSGRKGIGIEIDPQYIEVIRSRVKAAETPLFASAEVAS